jgi:hypothetical protein
MKFLDLLHEYPAWFKASFMAWTIATALLIGGLVFLRPTTSTSPHPAKTNTAPTAAAESDRPLTNITVKEIIEAVRNTPPLQQQDAAKNYIGLNVEWTGYLKTAEPAYGNPQKIRVNLNANEGEVIGYSIWFSIDLDTIPEFRLLHKESKIKVRGTITSVSVPGLSVDLNQNQVLILERTAK